jgi:hypothetical protein
VTLGLPPATQDVALYFAGCPYPIDEILDVPPWPRYEKSYDETAFRAWCARHRRRRD